MSDTFLRAQKTMPGGVNSPVRAFKDMGKDPIFMKFAQGAYLTDTDNRQYLDYVNGFGPSILGHCHSEVVKEILSQAQKALCFGTCHVNEITLAEKICQLMPNIKMLRMLNSGTEASMTAIRLARAATNRPLILKFAGGYHGHVDSLLVQAGSSACNFGKPSSLGILPETASNTIVANYNDLDNLDQILSSNANKIAAIIVEPIAGNMNCILPKPGFLQGLRQRCDKHKILLIFDEVMTGFRVNISGAQKIYNIQPDLTLLGKIIGGGLPVGAIGGSKELMKMLSPTGGVYQAGTLSGNPVTVASAIATLSILEKEQKTIYPQLNSYCEKLTKEMTKIAKKYSIDLQTQYTTGMFGFLFTKDPAHNLADVSKANSNMYTNFFRNMLMQGIYFAPSAFEASFISAQHQEIEMEMTLNAVARSFSCMKEYL